MPTIAPYGTWRSPITTELLVARTVRLADPLVDAGSIYWTEGRPDEGGRQVVVERRPDGTVRDVVPAGYSARTRVHEYGGLAVAVRDGVVVFSNFTDQRLYAVGPDGVPTPLTGEGGHPAAQRFAAPVFTGDGASIIAVRERHTADDVVNDLVAVSTSGDGSIVTLASGRDFYGSPALSPDGRRLAFCCWDHPRMPWDGAELVEVELGSDVSPGPARTVAGGPSESVTQPRYAPDGTLYFVSDRSGWWNLYRDASTAGGAVRPVVVADAEFAAPDWLFGNASYTFLDDGTVVATWTGAAGGALGRLEPGGSAFEPIETEFGAFSGIRSTGAGIVAIAGSPTRAAALVTLDPASGAADVIKASRGSAVDDGYLSTPRPLEYPTAGGRTAHALVYAPRNADFVAPDRERPPLIVAVHGGPTSAAPATLNYDIQYWTSRGFVVADVNYGGSTGLGREYRERLRGQWGVVDVEDAENVVRALVAAGEVDPARCVIHGGSAGGWTTLCALTFGDIFAAGASYFGVADLVGFAAETHKFESRYLDGLVGPAVGSEALYEERSPARHAEQIAVPLIVFQGLEDKIVPPNQSEVIVDALRAGGVPVAYLAYEGEQHGFRGAAAITRTAEAELYFYGRVFGFTPADELEPVEIENAEALTPPG